MFSCNITFICNFLFLLCVFVTQMMALGHAPFYDGRYRCCGEEEEEILNEDDVRHCGEHAWSVIGF